MYVYKWVKGLTLFWKKSCFPLLGSGFLGFTPLINGSEMLWKLHLFNFFTPDLSKTSQQQAPAYHSKQCYLVASGMSFQSKVILHLHLWLKHRNSNSTHVLGISKSKWRPKLPCDFPFNFVCLGCRNRRWCSYSFKNKLKVILNFILKKTLEAIKWIWNTAWITYRKVYEPCYLLWMCQYFLCPEDISVHYVRG